MEELFEYCNAFMILQRRGGEHMAYAEELIRRGCPVFIDKPVCATAEDVQKLKQLAANHDAVICGGSGFKHSKQIVRLKEQLAGKEFGIIHSATITYNADIDNPYDGIFFYLPHGVEIMLELFGYDPRDVQVDVRAHDDFSVYVCYRSYQVKLVMDGSKTCTVEINGDRQITEEIDAGDIFVENMRNFLTAIETRNVTKDTAKLTKHVDVILAVKAAIEKKEAL